MATAKRNMIQAPPAVLAMLVSLSGCEHDDHDHDRDRPPDREGRDRLGHDEHLDNDRHDEDRGGG